MNHQLLLLTLLLSAAAHADPTSMSDAFHQGATLGTSNNAAIHSNILTPLLVMALAYMLLFATLLLLRVRTAIIEHRLRTLAMTRVRG